VNAKWISRLAILAMPLAGFSLTASDARAQGYPNKPITFVVPYGPGSGNDVIARILANKLSENWGNPVMVLNRAGATGAVGLETTAKAAPDGYSIVIASTSQMINQHLSKVRYDMVRDFAPVSLSGTLSYSAAVLASFPAKTLNELVAMAKSNPGKLNYTGTIGSIAHFMGEMLKSAGNIDLVMIPNKLIADAEADVVSGRVEIWFAPLNNVLPYAKTGKMTVLGITGDKRAAELPDVPTMAEAGFPALDISANYYILAPAGTPKPIIAALNSEFVKAMGSKDVRDRLAAVGVDPKSSSPEEAGALLKSEVARWGKIVKESGIRVD
jgi:tripartite-type tricarboxylate transporter receptor subunit TctC